MKKIAAIILLPLICITYFSLSYAQHMIIRINQHVFKVIAAKTIDQQEKGLMNIKSLPENQGMLFAFAHKQKLSFWMKNTYIPLDILFLDEDYKIVDIQTMQPCGLLKHCPSYISATPAEYAIELNAGLAKKYDIKVGDQVNIISYH